MAGEEEETKTGLAGVDDDDIGWGKTKKPQHRDNRIVDGKEPRRRGGFF